MYSTRIENLLQTQL